VFFEFWHCSSGGAMYLLKTTQGKSLSVHLILSAVSILCTSKARLNIKADKLKTSFAIRQYTEMKIVYGLTV
jgi:hypothetical protein